MKRERERLEDPTTVKWIKGSRDHESLLMEADGISLMINESGEVVIQL
jgi:hypothetical protein